jgi:integrase
VRSSFTAGVWRHPRSTSNSGCFTGSSSAQRRHGLPLNVVTSVERQPIRRSGDFRVLSPAEVEALARAAGSPQDAAIFRVAAYTGLRLGELLALRWRDCDFDKRLVHVRRSFAADQEGMPKSWRVRSVSMIDQVVAALDDLSRRVRFVSDRDLVFRNEARDFMDGSALRRRLYAARDVAGLQRIRSTTCAIPSARLRSKSSRSPT